MSGIGIGTIIPSELESVKGEDIVKFALAYGKYSKQVTEFNRARNPSQRVPPTGIKACISAELLIDLTVLRIFPECSTVSDVTDQHVKDWIQSRSQCSLDDMDSQVGDALRRVRFNFDRSDPQGSALQFFTDVARNLRRNRVDQAIGQASKVIIRELIPKLEPRILRDSIRSSHKYWEREKKYDFQHFKTRVIETAAESAKYSAKRVLDDVEGSTTISGVHSSIKRAKNDHAKESEYNGAAHGINSKPSNSFDEPKNSSIISPSSAEERKNERSREEWTDPCLKKDCTGTHPVKDCPITSEDQKRQLLKEFYEARKKQGGTTSPP